MDGDFPTIDPVELKRDLDALRLPKRVSKIDSLIFMQRPAIAKCSTNRHGQIVQVDTSQPALRALKAREARNKRSSNSMSSVVERSFKRHFHPFGGTNY